MRLKPAFSVKELLGGAVLIGFEGAVLFVLASCVRWTSVFIVNALLVCFLSILNFFFLNKTINKIHLLAIIILTSMMTILIVKFFPSLLIFNFFNAKPKEVLYLVRRAFQVALIVFAGVPSIWLLDKGLKLRD